MAKIAFIGTGNMGSALARAASKAEENSLFLVNRHPEKAVILQQKTGGCVTDHKTAAENADYLFLGVKPRMLPEVAKTLSPILQSMETPPVLVSMLAGTEIRQLQQHLGTHCPVIRIMPNTPVSVGEGMILYCCSELVCTEDETAFLEAMRYAGRFIKLEEHLIDAGMAVSGCGPAYVDLFVEALADAGVACGLTRQDALLLAAQMTLGSARLILESGQHPGILKDAVCSPGGTTIQGVRKLEEKGFRSAVMEAVIAAYQA